MPDLPIESILAPGASSRPSSVGELLGTSREGREIIGYRLGTGPRSVSLIAGCHADEPIGPAMLDRLAAYLLALPATAPLLSRLTWFLVPHANPDGEARNLPWTQATFNDESETLSPDATLDLCSYLTHVVRELPGDDVEFGFPQHTADSGARPENRAIADFLRPAGPFVLHASFHGMAFAAGPWFLMEKAWIDRTLTMRDRLRDRVRALGYSVHDIDRGGDKGFTRIDEGFTTRPDSRAMAAHFLALDDPRTAALFRPSSMEFVRSLGGDPLTLVSEMPLFLVPAEHFAGRDVVRPKIVRQLLALGDPGSVRETAIHAGVRSMPIRDQMRLQLEFLQAGLLAAVPE